MELTLADALGIFRGWQENPSPVTFFLDRSIGLSLQTEAGRMADLEAGLSGQRLSRP